MSFNKRYINKDSISNAKKQGLDYLVKYIKNPDSIIIEDDYSRKVYNIIMNTDKRNINEKLKEFFDGYEC